MKDHGSCDIKEYQLFQTLEGFGELGIIKTTTRSKIVKCEPSQISSTRKHEQDDNFNMNFLGTLSWQQSSYNEEFFPLQTETGIKRTFTIRYIFQQNLMY